MKDEKKPDKKELTDEQKQETLNEIQQSILSRLFGKRALEHARRKWHKHYSPKAQKKRKVKRKAARKSRQQNRKKK